MLLSQSVLQTGLRQLPCRDWCCEAHANCEQGPGSHRDKGNELNCGEMPFGKVVARETQKNLSRFLQHRRDLMGRSQDRVAVDGILPEWRIRGQGLLRYRRSRLRVTVLF